MSLQVQAETKVGVLIVLSLVAVIWGGLAQITPLFFQKSTTEPVEGLKPYTALQLEGRDIYIREGCVGCHSQMIRPLFAETERYGEYSKPGESVYNHPFQWGSRRIPWATRSRTSGSGCDSRMRTSRGSTSSSLRRLTKEGCRASACSMIPCTGRN